MSKRSLRRYRTRLIIVRIKADILPGRGMDRQLRCLGDEGTIILRSTQLFHKRRIDRYTFAGLLRKG